VNRKLFPVSSVVVMVGLVFALVPGALPGTELSVTARSPGQQPTSLPVDASQPLSYQPGQDPRQASTASAPNAIRASDCTSSASIVVEWDAVTLALAYEVWRATSATGIIARVIEAP
jgi:hypothetical protein